VSRRFFLAVQNGLVLYLNHDIADNISDSRVWCINREAAHRKMPSPNLSSVLEELRLVHVSISEYLPVAMCNKSEILIR
jgi:hypothetical protein